MGKKTSGWRTRVRVTNNRRINVENWHRLCDQLAAVILSRDPDQRYTAGPQMMAAARAIIRTHNFGPDQYQQLRVINSEFLDRIGRSYSIKFAYGPQAFFEDTQSLLDSAGVPDLLQVHLGLSEMVAGMLTSMFDSNVHHINFVPKAA